MDKGAVYLRAKVEIAKEDFRSAVEAEKTRIRKAKWWHRLIPFTIIIIRRTTNDQ